MIVAPSLQSVVVVLSRCAFGHSYMGVWQDSTTTTDKKRAVFYERVPFTNAVSVLSLLKCQSVVNRVIKLTCVVKNDFTVQFYTYTITPYAISNGRVEVLTVMLWGIWKNTRETGSGLMIQSAECVCGWLTTNYGNDRWWRECLITVIHKLLLKENNYSTYVWVFGFWVELCWLFCWNMHLRVNWKMFSNF